MKVKNLILILGTIIAYLGIIGYVRMSNDRTLEERYYHEWREDYIKNKNQNEQYVNDFQKLDNYYLAHRLTNSNLMSWRQKDRKNIWRDNPVSASDGDIMVAQALLHANRV